MEIRLTGNEYFIDGVRYPSVREIIGQAIPGEAKPLLHDVIVADLIRGSGLSDCTKPYARAWKRMMKEHDISHLSCGKPIASPALMVAGTPDIEGSLDGSPMIAEIELDRGYFSSGPVLQGYKIIKGTDGIGRIPVTITLFADGKFQITSLAESEPEDRAMFFACLQVYRWKKMMGVPQQ